MKYKVGDKVKVRSDLKVGEIYGNQIFVKEMKKYRGRDATILEEHSNFYNIEEDKDENWDWAEEMFEPVVEMSVEELLKIIGNICEVHNECKKCPLLEIRGEEYCMIGIGKNADKTLKIAKQWKADHEKKPIETEFIWYLLVVEEKTHIVKYEKPLKIERERTTDEQKEELLREWCSEHDGKYYVTTEHRCVVKE